jgi:hypothetical protein
MDDSGTKISGTHRAGISISELDLTDTQKKKMEHNSETKTFSKLESF